ncbi:MAG TPA: tetratricopeptide repeat protein [Terriglobales bacterium]|nr:tetratricopeptide repeat protein [Terriglobales bacterium]
MTSGHFRHAGIYIAACVLAAAFAQSQDAVRNATLGTVQGYVRDSGGRPVANATVFLQPATGAATPSAQTQITHTDSEGTYRFAALPKGTYTLRAEMSGYDRAIVGPVSLAPKETKKIDLALVSAKASAAATQGPEYFDEPQFTVAGVTQATSAGGHGSDTVLRATEALAKATVSLSKEPAADSKLPPATTESSLLKAVALSPKDAALHHQLGDVEETLGHPLEAVREYQRAAELDPSELYLFDWGTELLTHRALEPATEVFTTGNHLFPKSVRMLIGLGVAWYARGSYDRAAQFLGNASELAPEDPTPYLFIGKMQSAETVPTKESVERLARFQQYEPDNPLANYYYAVSLWKWRQSVGALDDASSAQIEALLQKAVQLDSKLGAAYLQLGILYAQRGDYTRAIPAYQKAIEVSPELEETHYRLAQAYLRTGDKTRAQEELEFNRQLAKKTKEDAERKRREIQQFVILLRDKNSNSQPQH